MPIILLEFGMIFFKLKMCFQFSNPYTGGTCVPLLDHLFGSSFESVNTGSSNDDWLCLLCAWPRTKPQGDSIEQKDTTLSLSSVLLKETKLYK